MSGDKHKEYYKLAQKFLINLWPKQRCRKLEKRCGRKINFHQHPHLAYGRLPQQQWAPLLGLGCLWQSAHPSPKNSGLPARQTLPGHEPSWSGPSSYWTALCCWCWPEWSPGELHKRKRKQLFGWVLHFRWYVTHKCNIWTKQSVPVGFGLWSSAAIYLFIYLYYSQKVRDAQLSYRISQCTLNTQWPLHVNLFHLLKTFVCTCPVFLQRGD